MKTHRPWQPHMNNSPLFNPFAPGNGRATTLDHFDLIEADEEGDETERSGKESDQAGDSPSMAQKD
jgi:hypothetical protein